ncbi:MULTISPECIES: integrase core domain-containing protein [unclassified Akkermansia]|uniref:integrase core domain-containing protein n=1 Tax=unclassified Akkermansia TaxID=2608915 RepID=UPI0031B6DF96
MENLNASLGRELLDREIFDNMEHLQTRLEQWRREHNEERPHASCGNNPPSLYAGQN